ncbi:MAG: acyl carrier protein [Bacteroidales bacterium]|nr:acyl carrier protein [Bacteroidales bacterium]
MKSDMTEIKGKVKEYIHQAVYTDKDKIKDDSLIFKEGFMDSMGFITLITYLEEQFGISTGDADLLEENFESINAISDFVMRKLMN